MGTNLTDIGIVTYQLQEESGQLIAKWYHSDLDSGKLGTGIATPRKAKGFEGSFDITYYSNGGETVGTFKLSITQILDAFSLKWLDGDSIVYVGLGIVEGSYLSVGWRKARND